MSTLTTVLKTSADFSTADRLSEVLASRAPVPIGPEGMHVMHCYYTADPSDPVTGRVLVWLSQAPDAHTGDLAMVDPKSGDVQILAAGLMVEDAHRQATQMLVNNGQWAVFHHLVGDSWVVESVEIATGKRRVLGTDCQLGFAHQSMDLVTLISLHWAPGDCGDLRIVRVSDGSPLHTVRLETVVDQIRGRFPGPLPAPGEGSLCAPFLSPNATRLILKMSQPMNGKMRDAGASNRTGMIGYDLTADTVLFAREEWGHPAWHPNSRHIHTVELGGFVLIDSDSGEATPLSQIPRPMGSHPSIHPDGHTIITDMSELTDGAYTWHIGVADIEKPGLTKILDCGPHAGGTTSWRQAHVHPVFDRSGHRLYYNKLGDPWVRLHYLEI